MDRPNGSIRPGAVALREVTEEDLSVFFQQQRDPEATQMAAFPARERAAFMAHWARVLRDESLVKQTILCDGQVAGYVVCFGQEGEREVGYWLGRAYWGQGIATRALSAFLGHVKVRPLYAHVAKHNLGSRRVLEKCGFTLLGEDHAPAGAAGGEVEEFVLILKANATAAAP